MWLFAQSNTTSPPVVNNPGVTSIPRAVTEEELNKKKQGEAGTTPTFSIPGDFSGGTLGRFHKRDGTLEIEALLLDRYKDSVVRIRVLDRAGINLGESLGVSVGITASGAQVGDSIYIATPLSLILNNPVQWGDKIEVEHYSGTKYNAEIAIISEKLDIVLLRPKNYPQPVRFVEPRNERNQLDVITIGFQNNGEGGLEAISHSAVMAATNSKDGTLAIAGAGIHNAQAGTAILNMQGQLMGMLLPNHQGVLSSAIVSLIKRAKEKKLIPPVMLGVIMGKGVLVDRSLIASGAYISIEDAIKDIQSGKAPKADLSRFIPSHKIHYRKPSKVVLKVGPGTYSFKKALEVPSNISIAGSGSGLTTFTVKDQKQSVLLLKNVENVFISNLRLQPKGKQDRLQSTVFIQDSGKIVLLGNLVESNGGRGIHAIGSKHISLIGNSFSDGANKAVYCQQSSVKVEASSFLGPHPQALAVGKACYLSAENNLFMENKVGVAISGRSTYVRLRNNTFIHTLTGVRFYGYYPKLEVEDNLFYKGRFSFLMVRSFRPSLFGKNSSWGNVAFLRKKRAEGLQFVKGKPIFRNPRNYDFRLRAGSPGSLSGKLDDFGVNADMGAFQSSNFLGNYTRAFLITLEAATGEKNLAEKWGYK